MQKPDISIAGMVVLEKNGAKLKFASNASQFDTKIETVSLTDKRLADVWGNEIYRLLLNARKRELSGKYKFLLKKE
ncbi:MAG: hypothetical protein JW857_08910 [Bacteroidales bacterium]|nr:hypothetical protein [Bacteroidales bacterium]